jgi:leucyl aminopeptidase
MSLKLSQNAAIATEKSLTLQKHTLFVLPDNYKTALPFQVNIDAKLKRSQATFKDCAKTPLLVELPNGGLLSIVILNEKLSMFQKHTLLRKAVKPLLDETPSDIAICVFGDDATREAHACAVYYVTSVNAAELPSRKKDNKSKPLKEISIYGYKAAHDYGYVNARVAGNTLCRSLTMLPPNELNPTSYRAKVKALAKEHGWTHEEFDMPALKKMGAGAFYAVGQGSEPMDAAIVHLTYSPKVATKTPKVSDENIYASLRDATNSALASLTTEEAAALRLRFGIDLNADEASDNVGKQFEATRARIREIEEKALSKLRNPARSVIKHIALVGKGICFDTGGHNLKPAKYMQGMHEDMNGSAVALGVLTAATMQQLPVKIDCWLAIAQNHIGPLAYKQNDVVTALNGLTIEIVHTDAEGRMVLADTLTLASRQNPDVILDYATLTGSMAVAVGDRMSGIISNRPELACKAVGAGAAAGERIVAFPNEDDFDSDLESDIADIKQCTLEGGGDHIHATRFMSKFIENDVPWVHADLSSTNRKGGLGAVESTVNGFGVGFGLALVKMLLE